VRVIAGALGGRRLTAPRGAGTRPTSDRVREALFMMLEPLAGLRVVDLYAGSGALGIEALSRGAVHADFAEADRGALRALRANLDTLGLAACATVWASSLPRGLARMRETLAAADLVLLDPPYGGEAARGALEALEASGALGAGTRVVVEHHVKDDLPEQCGALELERARRYGETQVTVYRVGTPRRTAEEGPS
jgi:16S rRNA (guanine966-N2)-methyltransferase